LDEKVFLEKAGWATDYFCSLTHARQTFASEFANGAEVSELRD